VNPDRAPHHHLEAAARPRYKYHKMTMAKMLQTIVTIPATPRKSNSFAGFFGHVIEPSRISAGEYHRSLTWALRRPGKITRFWSEPDRLPYYVHAAATQ